MTRCPLFFLLVFAMMRTAAAETLLLAPDTPIIAGGQVRFTVLVLNEAETPRAYQLPRAVQAQLVIGGAHHDALLTAESPAESATLVAPGGFHRAVFLANLPADVAGTVRLVPLDRKIKGTLLTVQATERDVAPPAAERRVAEGAPEITPDARFAAAISAYEPVYFSVGTRGRDNAKFQLSFKYRLFTPAGSLIPGSEIFENLYFGYTQTSNWDLESNSRPFHDSSYCPGLFYYREGLWTSRSGLRRLGLETGLEHESNGRDGPESRGIDVAYVRPQYRVGDPNQYHFTLAPKVWAYLDRDDNPDIHQYRGYADVLLKYGKPTGWQFSTNLRRGTRGRHYSMQLDITYPLRAVALGNLNGYLHAQYFNGWGENILEYNIRSRPQFRLGLMLVR